VKNPAQKRGPVLANQKDSPQNSTNHIKNQPDTSTMSTDMFLCSRYATSKPGFRLGMPVAGHTGATASVLAAFAHRAEELACANRLASEWHAGNRISDGEYSRYSLGGLARGQGRDLQVLVPFFGFFLRVCS
jgi:hypothetical protein